MSSPSNLNSTLNMTPQEIAELKQFLSTLSAAEVERLKLKINNWGKP